MHTVLFMLGNLVVMGGLVLLIMRLLTAGEREARRQEEARHRPAVPEAEEERLPKAA